MFFVRQGNKQQPLPPSDTNPGECTLHARTCGMGVGVFFLVQKVCLLLIHGNRAIYSSPLYLDSNGEAAAENNRSRNRPLFLSMKRIYKAEEIYFNNLVPFEVSRQLGGSERVIRPNWY